MTLPICSSASAAILPSGSVALADFAIDAQPSQGIHPTSGSTMHPARTLLRARPKTSVATAGPSGTKRERERRLSPTSDCSGPQTPWVPGKPP